MVQGYRISMTGTLMRGILAGGAGTALLDAATWVDVLATGRPTSSTPQQTVARLLARASIEVPKDENRLAALGALSGLVAGAGVGVLASAARRAHVRLPAPAAAVLIGAAAMAVSDGTATALGVTDPRDWTAADWARDAVPHLLFGLAVHEALERMESLASRTRGTTSDEDPAPRSRGALLGRSFALGLASGSRTSLGALGVVRNLGGAAPALIGVGLVGTELTLDKLPQTPSRLSRGALAGRGVAGALGAAALARRQSAAWLLPAVVGVVGAGLGAIVGAAFRDLAADRGLTWQAGLVEDGIALTLTAMAMR